MFGMPDRPAKIPERERYLAFFNIQKELLSKNKVKAENHLSLARKGVKLGELKRTDKSFKRCMIVPDTPKPLPGPETISSGADATKSTIPQERPQTPLEAPNGTLSDPEPITKDLKAKRSEQPVYPSSNESVQSAQRKKGQKTRRTLGTSSGKKLDSQTQVELEAYPTPLSIKDVPLPPLSTEARATSSAPDGDISLTQEAVAQR